MQSKNSSKHLNTEINIKHQLDCIRRRLENYSGAKLKFASDGKNSKEQQLPPNKLAHKSTTTNAKLRALRYNEIPPHLDQWNNLVYPKYMLTFGTRGPAWKQRLDLEQFGANYTRHGIQFASAAPPAFPKQFAPLLGPDQYGNTELFNRRPRSTIGYQALASKTARWPVRGQPKLITPARIPVRRKKLEKKPAAITEPPFTSSVTCISRPHLQHHDERRKTVKRGKEVARPKRSEHPRACMNKTRPMGIGGPTFYTYAADPTEPKPVKSCPESSPFYVSGPRFPEARVVLPGPGSYNIHNIKIGRRIMAQHKLGHGAFIPPPFHVRCSHRKKEKCHMCKLDVWCLPTYYALPRRKVYLCPLCYHVQRKMAVTLKPRTIGRMRRVVDCGWLHTHKHFPDSDRILTHATLAEVKWLARKELYMHLHFPKIREPIPQSGVRRYAAP